jgi:hypothetical protein
MCLPANIPFLKYNWKDQVWKLYFAAGLLLGGFISGVLLKPASPLPLSKATIQELKTMGISYNDILPVGIFSWANLFAWQNLLIVIGGGFLVGFGTRYAGGCTSGHGISGLSTLQWPSLVAVIVFFASGIVTANFLLPLIMR